MKRIQEITICKGTKTVPVNSFEAGTELIPYETYKGLCKFSKEIYCTMVLEHYRSVMGGLHMILTDSDNPFERALGELFGCTDCATSGKVLDYSTLRVLFLIINVMESI